MDSLQQHKKRSQHRTERSLDKIKQAMEVITDTFQTVATSAQLIVSWAGKIGENKTRRTFV